MINRRRIFSCRDGGIGRHKGLKIPRFFRTVRVQVSLSALSKPSRISVVFCFHPSSQTFTINIQIILKGRYAFGGYKSHLETVYNQVKETVDNLAPDVVAKFLSYPIPKAIVAEWDKVRMVKNKYIEEM